MRGLKKLIEQTPPMNDLYVGTTDDGCFIDVKQGVQRVRLEVPLDQGIDIAASIVVACLPTALRNGHTIDSFFEAVAERVGQRAHEAVEAAVMKSEAS